MQANAAPSSGSHVWATSKDADLFAPASVVHRARGRVDLKVKRHVGDLTSEQHIVVSNADFEELSPLVDLAELALAEQGQLLDAALMRAPTPPALLHLLRRRFQAGGTGSAWFGGWLCTQHASSRTQKANTTSTTQSEADESIAALNAAAAFEARPEPTVAVYGANVLQRMLTLRRAQAIAVLGDGTCADSISRVLRLVRHAHEARACRAGAELAECAEAGLLALHAFAEACTGGEEAGGRLHGAALWLRLRFDDSGRLVRGRLRGTLLHPARIAAGCDAKEADGTYAQQQQEAGGTGVAAPPWAPQSAAGTKPSGGNVAVLYAVRLLLAGATRAERRELRLDDLVSLKASLAVKEPASGEDGSVASAMAGMMDELRFRRLREKLMLAGVDGDAQKQLWRVLAALLHIASMDEGRDADAGQSSPPLEFCADLLGVTSRELGLCVAARRAAGGGGETAVQRRLATVSTIYHSIFDWLLHQIDHGLQAVENGAAPPPKLKPKSPKPTTAATSKAANSDGPTAPPPAPDAPAGAGIEEPPAKETNPFLAQMMPGRAAKLKSRMSMFEDSVAETGSAPPDEKGSEEIDAAAQAAAGAWSKGHASGADDPAVLASAEAVDGMELGIAWGGGCADAGGGLGALLSNYSADRLTLGVQRASFIRLREAMRTDGLDAPKLALPEASDAVDTLETPYGPLSVLAEERGTDNHAARLARRAVDGVEPWVGGVAFNVAHFGQPVAYSVPSAATAPEWLWHQARPDVALLRLLLSSHLPLLADAARQMLSALDAPKRGQTPSTAKRGPSSDALEQPSERLRSFHKLMAHEMAEFEMQPLVSLSVTKPPNHELRLRASKGRQEQSIHLEHSYDSRHVHACILRLGLVSYCTHTAQPTTIIDHSHEIYRLMHPIRAPLTSMRREKVEALLRHAGERFAAAIPPAWLIGKSTHCFLTDAAMLGLLRAVRDARWRHVVKLQAHGRRKAAARRVTARRADLEAVQLEADIEAEMRRMVEELQPEALALLKLPDGVDDAAVDPTAQQVETVFKRLERLARAPAMAPKAEPAPAAEPKKRKPRATPLVTNAADGTAANGDANGPVSEGPEAPAPSSPESAPAPSAEAAPASEGGPALGASDLAAPRGGVSGADGKRVVKFDVAPVHDDVSDLFAGHGTAVAASDAPKPKGGLSKVSGMMKLSRRFTSPLKSKQSK